MTRRAGPGEAGAQRRRDQTQALADALEVSFNCEGSEAALVALARLLVALLKRQEGS